VSRDQLKQLLETCSKVVDASELVPGKVTNGYTFKTNGEKVYDYQDGQVINSSTVAKRLLPTQSGFFFGSTDYDQWYYEDLERTVLVLKDELAKGNATDDYEYWSSW
jgi:hypothetical protein